MDLDALARRYEEVDSSAEEKLLREIFAGGWEAGCWLRVPDDSLLLNSRDQVDKLLDSVKNRKRLFLNYGDDPHPSGLAHVPVEDIKPCFVVVGQRCDLIAQFRTEPLIELTPARHTSNKGDIRSRWKTSPREFPLDPDVDATFMVDVRSRFWLPKIDLLQFEPKQGLPANAPPNHARFRFSLRFAQRYNRTALPDSLVEAALRPLNEIMSGDTEADTMFSEWMIYHGERWPAERPALIGVYALPPFEELSAAERQERQEVYAMQAENKFEATVNELTARSPDAKKLLNLEDDPTGAIDDAVLPYALWRASWKLDLDAHTFSGAAGGALPDR